MTELTIAVTEFKAKSLRLLDDLAAGRLSRIIVTRRGKQLAVVSPVAEVIGAPDLFGAMRGRSWALVEHDLTRPIYDGPDPSDPFLDGTSDAAA